MIRRLDLIIALYMFGVITAELMGAKTFLLCTIGSFHVTASVAVFVMPLLFTAIDAIVEVYGKKRARSIVLSGLLMVALLVPYAAIATGLHPTSFFAASEPAYERIFHASIRMSIASIAAFAASELLDVLIFAKLRQKLQGRALWLRNNLTNFSAQFVDSAVFLTLAFYSLQQSAQNNVSFLLGLLLPYWMLRCGLSIIETPLVYLAVFWLRSDKSRTDNPSMTIMETNA